MELYCPKCKSAQKRFKIVMPTSVMVINSDDGFKTANLAELRNIADLLAESTCKVCGGKLDFIPDEYSEYSKYETINELDDVDLSSEVGPSPLNERRPEPEELLPTQNEPAPEQVEYKVIAKIDRDNSQSWSH